MKNLTLSEIGIIIIVGISIIVGIVRAKFCIPYLLNFDNTILDIPAICITR